MPGKNKHSALAGSVLGNYLTPVDDVAADDAPEQPLFSNWLKHVDINSPVEKTLPNQAENPYTSLPPPPPTKHPDEPGVGAMISDIGQKDVAAIAKDNADALLIATQRAKANPLYSNKSLRDGILKDEIDNVKSERDKQGAQQVLAARKIVEHLGQQAAQKIAPLKNPAYFHAVMPGLRNDLPAEAQVQYGIADQNGQPTDNYLLAVHNAAGGDVNKYQQAAQNILDYHADDWQQYVSMQGKAQRLAEGLHDNRVTDAVGDIPLVGNILSSVARAPYYADRAITGVTRSLGHIGNYLTNQVGSNLLYGQQAANAMYAQGERNVDKTYPDAVASGEQGSNNIDKALSMGSSMIGGFAPFAALGDVPILPEAETFGAAPTIMQRVSKTVDQATAGMDNTALGTYGKSFVHTMRSAYPQIYSQYFDEGIRNGLTEDQAADRASDRAVKNVAFMSAVNPGVMMGNKPMSKTVSNLLNGTDKDFSSTAANLLAHGRRMGLDALKGGATFGGLALTDAYQNAQEQGKPFDLSEALPEIKDAVLGGAIFDGIRSGIESGKYPVSQPHALATFEAITKPADFQNTLAREVERGVYTPEQAQMMQGYIARLTPEVNAALARKLKPVNAVKAAVEAERGKEATKIYTEMIGENGLARGVVVDADGKKVALDPEKGIYTEDAAKNLTDQYDKFKNMAADALSNHTKAMEGTDMKGRTVSGEEMAALSQKYTPSSSLSTTQADAIINGGPYHTEQVDLKQFESDPEIAKLKAELPHDESLPQNTNPIVLDDSNNIIDGKKRIALALSRGDKTIEVARPLTQDEVSRAAQAEHDSGTGTSQPAQDFMPSTHDNKDDVQAAAKIFNEHANTDAAYGVSAALQHLKDEGYDRDNAIALAQEATGGHIPLSAIEGLYKNLEANGLPEKKTESLTTSFARKIYDGNPDNLKATVDHLREDGLSKDEAVHTIQDIAGAKHIPEEIQNAYDNISSPTQSIPDETQETKGWQEGLLNPADAEQTGAVKENTAPVSELAKQLKLFTDEPTITAFAGRTADQVEQSEPIVAGIERKAEGDDETSLNEAVKEADALIAGVTGRTEAVPGTDEQPRNRPVKGRANVLVSGAAMEKAGWDRESAAALRKRLAEASGTKDLTLNVVENKSPSKGSYDPKTKTITINIARARPETTLHEMGHFWTSWAKEVAPELHAKGIELSKGSEQFKYASVLLNGESAPVPKGMSATEAKLWQKYAKQYASHSDPHGALADEVLAQTIEQEAKNLLPSDRTKFSQWLKEFFDLMKGKMGFGDLSAQKFANLTLKDFAQHALAEFSKGEDWAKEIAPPAADETELRKQSAIDAIEKKVESGNLSRVEAERQIATVDAMHSLSAEPLDEDAQKYFRDKLAKGYDKNLVADVLKDRYGMNDAEAQDAIDNLSSSSSIRYTRSDMADISQGGLQQRGSTTTNPELVTRNFGVGDPLKFFAERERRGIWNGKTITEDKSGNPWGVAAILNDPSGWIEQIGKSKPADVPRETSEPVDRNSYTSVKNERVDQEREARGLPPAIQAAHKEFGKTWDEADKILKRNPGAAKNLAEALDQKPRPLTDVENALLLHRQIELQNEYGKVMEAMDENKDDPQEIGAIRGQMARVLDDLQQMYDVGKAAGTENARGLNTRKMLAAEDYSLANMMAQERAANNGQPLSQEVQAQIKELHDKIAKTQQAFDDYVARTEKERQNKGSKEEIKKTVKEMVGKRSKNADPAKVKDRIKNRLQSIRDRLMGDTMHSLSEDEGTPLHTSDVIPPEFHSDIKALAKDYIELGVNDADELTKKLHADLKDMFDGLSEREVRDAVSDYGKITKPSEDEVLAKLRELNAQNRLISAYEDAQAGVLPLKTGFQHDEPSKKVVELRKKVIEAMGKSGLKVTDPETQLKGALEAFKKRIAKNTAAYEDRIRTKNFDPTPRRKIELDREALKLKAENERAKDEWDRRKREYIKAGRTKWEKAQDNFVMFQRMFKLSGLKVLGKLTAAALWRIGSTPLEEVVGGGLSFVLPKVAEKAARQGGFNIKAEAHALTKGFMRGISDGWKNIALKKNTDPNRKWWNPFVYKYGGKSDLEATLGKKGQIAPEMAEYFGHLHSALKAVPKRVEFERSFQKRSEFLMKQGVDVSDPVVQVRIATEAYKDANHAIFMGDNAVADWWKAGINRLEQIDKLTGKPKAKELATLLKWLVPFVKVPTNIVLETGYYAGGSLSGSYHLIKAFAKGMENLKPEEAELILKHLKKGSLGLAFMALGYFNPQAIGGYYQKGGKQEDDVDFGGLKLFGVELPKFLVHNPLLETLQIGATIRKVSDKALDHGEEGASALGAGTKAALMGIGEEVPFSRLMQDAETFKEKDGVTKVLNEMAKNTADPAILQEIAKWTDPAAKRYPEHTLGIGTAESIATGLPGLRELVTDEK